MAFCWRVAEAGYAWETSGVERALVVKRPWPSRPEEPTVRHTALFRTFAGVAPEPDAVLEFASEYGHLGEFVWVQGGKFDPARARDTDALNASLLTRTSLEPARLGRERAETLSFWRGQIHAMRAAFDRWDGIQAGKVDPDEMGQVVEVVSRGCEGRVESRFVYDSQNRTAGWVTTPLDLLGAMWLQFADAVAGGKRVRQCPVCADWFAVTPGHARADKLLCSLACRQKAYRERKQRAVELFAQNGSVEKTAAELDWDVDAVKKWVKNTKPNGGDPDNAGDGPFRRGIDL